MNTSFQLLLGLVVLTVALVGGYLFYERERGGGNDLQVTSFEECAREGGPIMESYPRQCRHNGETFVEDIGNELEKMNLIRIDSPRPNALVTSPLTLKGEARGGWYFEASFPVRIEDAEGNILGRHYATAQGEWMSEEFVPFESTFTFETPETPTGVLILEKDNPSGLPEHADELRVPIQFTQESGGEELPVLLYYYDPQKDTDKDGNIMCSEKGLVSVERKIPFTQTPLEDSIRALLRGELTGEEKEQGVTTEFPLAGVSLESVLLKDGIATLTFSDLQFKTSGGSCRVGILWFQIRETALQFDSVDEVRFLPEELFQP